MNPSYLIYLCDNVGSVFDSQVLALLKEIKAKDVFNKVYLFLGFREENQKDELLKKKDFTGIEVIFFKSYPNYPLFNFLYRRSLKNALNSINKNFNEVIFHTRGEMIAWHLSNVLEHKYITNIIPDVRGANVEEIKEFGEFNVTNKFLKLYNNRRAVYNLKRFKKISVVSDALKDYLVDNYGIDPSYIYVIPCLAGYQFKFDKSSRQRIRKELLLDNKDLLIVFSSGGTAKWQNNDVLTLLADKGLKVLNLSKIAIEHKNIINKFVDYLQISDYLNAADFAIIWRDISVVNKVASPVKFGEYVCCGLPVIANDSVDLINRFIRKYNFGFLINTLNAVDLSVLSEQMYKERDEISRTGISYFGIDVIVSKYLIIYSLKNN